MSRPQFSIRTLLWLTLVVAAFLGGMAWQRRLASIELTKREQELAARQKELEAKDREVIAIHQSAIENAERLKALADEFEKHIRNQQ